MDRKQNRIVDHRGPNCRPPLAGLFRQPVYKPVGWTRRRERRRAALKDPTFRLIGSEKSRERGTEISWRVGVYYRCQDAKKEIPGSDDLRRLAAMVER